MEADPAPDLGRSRPQTALTAFLDTNVLVRHLTGDPPEMAARATRFLSRREVLVLTDVVVAETVYVLESYYELARPAVAELIEATLSLGSIRVLDLNLLLRSLEIYRESGLAYVDAYLLACAELSGIRAVASFDRELARHSPVEIVGP